MASEPIECQVLVLRVSIHCEGCKKKVKKVLQNINGVYRCEIDARSNKVSVTASTKLDPYIIVAKLRKSGKQADLWPEQPAPPQQPPPPAESQSQEPKNDADEQSKPSEPADNAEAAAAEPPSNPQPPPEANNKQSTAAGETSKPAHESKEPTGGEAPAAPAEPQHHHHRHPHEAKGKAKQPPPPPPEMEKQPVDARVTVEYDRGVGGGYGGYGSHHMPPPPQQHVVMSYNQARPSMSASYYAPAPAAAPAPMARPGPSQPQGYIDEHYTPSYYGRPSPSPYEPYYYNPPPQPSPYRYQSSYQPTPAPEEYYYSAPPQRSAFSPPRDGYGDMFNDENANSCSVM